MGGDAVMLFSLLTTTCCHLSAAAAFSSCSLASSVRTVSVSLRLSLSIAHLLSLAFSPLGVFCYCVVLENCVLSTFFPTCWVSVVLVMHC